mmetsp:Transcript_4696/g.7545  ORF Transcript_4696/g.7545 Transcript_4696/m.7545 type:complete len:92 (-) Transcript_4696:737-1012(-)
MAGRKPGANLQNQFDPEVLDVLRKQFDAADRDKSGEIDAEEAVQLFARFCGEGQSEADVRRTAESLRNQLDTDRSGVLPHTCLETRRPITV